MWRKAREQGFCPHSVLKPLPNIPYTVGCPTFQPMWVTLAMCFFAPLLCAMFHKGAKSSVTCRMHTHLSAECGVWPPKLAQPCSLCQELLLIVYCSPRVWEGYQAPVQVLFLGCLSAPKPACCLLGDWFVYSSLCLQLLLAISVLQQLLPFSKARCFNLLPLQLFQSIFPGGGAGSGQSGFPWCGATRDSQ